MNPDRRPGTPRLLRALNDRSALELLLAHGPLTRAQVGVVHSAVVEAAKDAGAAMTKVHQVVLGTPGLVDPDSGDIAFAWDLPRWHRGLLEALRADLRRPVIFANDVNLAAVAEADRGAAAGVDDFVMVWVGRGLGLAIMLDGRLHHGSSGAAGEIGYLPVPGGQVPHGVSKRVKGSFQRVAGTEAVRALARARGFKAATAAGAIAAAVAAGP